ncbi:hypothetical protein [Tropicimonas isoalkanivorans]|uniref:Uncharacterized protein n=1 Tax=Tropicimonas isoalkanivorans TaxID=441112 RepID=A0A1I1PZF9_9RHOB|nr:hypothetical protein [Tropicimonas isoalkanivorans]SFD15286.1 hypothetical protein SAMN04488094_11765 [Tropicimonas isoalkanivorans]
MSLNSPVVWLLAALAAALLAALFALYRNPVLEIYLSNWSLC